MSHDKPTKRWKPEDIDRMLAMLPVIEAEGFVSHTWGGGEKLIVRGVECTQMPYPIYHPVVQTLWKECYESSAWIDPYARLPEDPPVDEEAGHLGLAVFPDVDSFAQGSLNQIRRYLVLCTRGERFCDGFIAGEFETGRLRAALLRLRELRGAMPASGQ